MEKNKRELIQRRQALNNIPVYNTKPQIKQQQNKLEPRITACSVLGRNDKENSGLLPKPKVQQCKKTNTNNYIKIECGPQLTEKQPTQVQSIIIDSKITQVQKQSNITRAAQSQISSLQQKSFLNRFQIQVDTINSQIEAQLSNIEEALQKLKHKKQLKSRNKLARNNPNSHHIIQQSKTYQNNLKTSNEVTSESYIQVQQDIDKPKELFPQEYFSLISRLSRQIERDIEFTTKVNYYTKTKQIAQIQAQCLKEIANLKLLKEEFNQSFLKIQPAEMDPLDSLTTQASQTTNAHQIHQNAVSLLKDYRDLQAYYANKLYKQFQTSTIQLLFKELCQFNLASGSCNNTEIVTVGHLLSYINMKTNKSFRNRSFVKMLKRLNLKPNSVLNVQAFVQLTKL